MCGREFQQSKRINICYFSICNYLESKPDKNIEKDMIFSISWSFFLKRTITPLNWLLSYILKTRCKNVY